MLRFFLTRRWIGLLLAVVVVGIACIELGLWQFDRYTDRHDRNDTTSANLDADPVPVETVMVAGRGLPPSDEWTVVEATGTYDVEQTVVVRYRTLDGAPGVEVVVPLVTDAGVGLLVDRGWVQTAGNGDLPDDIPAPPPGTVRVTGWARVDATGDETKLDDGSVRAISSTAIGETVPYPLFGGFVDLTEEQPSVTPAPRLADPPDLGSGPHFFYGLQWFFFALLAFAFWCYFAWSEYRSGSTAPGDRAAEAPPPE